MRTPTSDHHFEAKNCVHYNQDVTVVTCRVIFVHYVNRWILSKAKKDNVDAAVSKYDGEYSM